MNITEFAEQIVFGKTIEQKLASPGRLSIDPNRRQRKPVGRIVAPGRPYGLEMRTGPKGNTPPPHDNTLENETERGKLLHFLANHELLATELMALVLLKFPDAPHAFRQGVLVTLQEEQAHTQMYIDRMRDCGVEFGTYPVSGQFWQIIEPMQSPMDFVSRLSLTFEQANLDFSQHFAKVFKRIGDNETAAVLEQIYLDEIGHVQHGLEWFRQWKDPAQSDWDAYQDSLEFPMSPQRGRAPSIQFNRDGRKRAGLTEDFIDAIEVFRQSRGRATSVRWFDAGAELELTGTVDAKSGSLVDQLNRDLELIMLPLAKADDVLLVNQMPSRELKKHLSDSGFPLPEFVLKKKREPLLERKLHDVSPWAWTPNSCLTAKEFDATVRHRSPNWQENTADLYRKSWSTSRLSQWLTEGQRLDESDDSIAEFCCGPEVVGQPIHSIEELESARSAIRERGFESLVFKPDMSASGRGQKRLPTGGDLNPHDLRWLTSFFGNKNQPACAVVEPELDRVFDFSMLWKFPLGSTEPVFQDWNQQIIGPGRKYIGSVLDKSLFGCSPEIRRFFLSNKCGKVNRVATWLQNRLAPILREQKFTGPFGVDAMIYRDLTGQLKIKPMVELNPRTTMGHVSLAIAKRLAKGASGQFRIFTASQWRANETQFKKIPLERSNDGPWKSGVIQLGEIKPMTKLVPGILIGNALSVALK
jgi:uncharacterized ferritin-like protein (DUF455 family)